MMRRRSRRRPTAHHGMSGHTMFGSTGWLFADLLLALALAFLLATTVNTPPPAPHPKPAPPPTQPHKPPPKPAQPVQALDFNVMKVFLDVVPSSVSASAIQNQILNDPRFKGQHAGFVLIFAGGTYNSPQWEELDRQVWSILHGMGKKSPLFAGAADRQFWGNSSLSQVELDIYLFKDPVTAGR